MECVNVLLAKPPRDRRDATLQFRYFSSRLGELNPEMVARLMEAHFVPKPSQEMGLPKSLVSKDIGGLATTHLRPRRVYLGSSTTYAGIFDFVDFGQEANAFLLKCGSKHEPTKFELADMMASEPARLLGVVGDADKYLGLLRTLADDVNLLKGARTLWRQLQSSAFLLGSVEVGGKQNHAFENSYDKEPSNEQDIEYDTPITQYKLVKPREVVIVSSLPRNAIHAEYSLTIAG